MGNLQSYTLRLEKYCDFCPHFEPDVDKVDITNFGDPEKKVLTTIRCEHRGMCEQIAATMYRRT